jgi:hypothetical protein
MQNKITTVKKMPWLKVILLVTMVVAADQICGWVLSQMYQRTKSGPEYGTRYSAEETRADIVIIGASRAQQQYNPLFLQDSLGTTAYNAGRDGMPFFYYFSIFRCITERYTPKKIILDCEYNALTYSATGFERLSTLLPLSKNHPEINDMIALRHPLENYKLYSATYPFNSMLFKIALGQLPSNNEETKRFNGYSPLYGKLTRTAPKVSHKKYMQLDTLRLQLLDEMINTCRKKNIQLIFVCPPYYMQNIDENPCIAHFEKVADKNSIPFFDYAADTFFLSRPQLWEDTIHVNYEGSKIFSAKLASDLKKLNKAR